MKQVYFECHGHIMMDGGPYARSKAAHLDAPSEQEVRRAFSALRDAGTVYFRDGGDRYGVSLLARKIAPEYGIEYASPAFALSLKGRYGSMLGRTFGNETQCRDLIREARAQGADHLKLIASGILTFEKDGELSCEGLDAQTMERIVVLAKQEGLPVMVHANGSETVEAAVKAGADSIEHGYLMKETVLERMADTGTVWVPTLAAVEVFTRREGVRTDVAQAALTRQEELLRKAQQQGVLIASGSDSGAFGVPHGMGIQRENMLLEAAGIHPETVRQGNERIREVFHGIR